MDFKVATDSRVGLSSGSLRIRSAERSQSRGGNLGRVAETTAAPSADPVRLNSSVLAQNAQNAIDIASQAAEAISALRSEQAAYASLASDTADPEKQAAYGNEIDSLQSEISRIGSEARYNDQNVLEGVAVTISDEASGVQTAISSANLSGLKTDPGVSVSDQAAAESAQATLEALDLSTRIAANGTSAAFAKAGSAVDQSIKEVDLERTGEKQAAQLDDPEKLAEQVAAAIRSKFGEGDTEEALLAHALEPERVSALTQE